jgi:hypothetical protein
VCRVPKHSNIEWHRYENLKIQIPSYLDVEKCHTDFRVRHCINKNREYD